MSAGRPMQALQLAAEYHGAVLAIVTSAERRDARGRRFLSAKPGARLGQLAVVRPNRDAPTRTDQLYTGRVLCRASLAELSIDEAAELLLAHESLKHRRPA